MICDLSIIVSLQITGAGFIYLFKIKIPQAKLTFVLVFVFERQIRPLSTVYHNVYVLKRNTAALCNNQGILYLR